MTFEGVWLGSILLIVWCLVNGVIWFVLAEDPNGTTNWGLRIIGLCITTWLMGGAAFLAWTKHK